MLKETVKTTVFLEDYQHNIIMYKNVIAFRFGDENNLLISVRDGDKIRRHFYNLETLLWYEVKTSTFVEIIEEGGDA